MALFQSSVLKKHLKLQDSVTVSKAYKKYSTYFLNPTIQENIRNSKEEQFQAIFLTELFVKILGYTINPSPNYNLTTEFKNEKNNRKADGAILADGKTVGVVELKGTKTKDLESIRRQAFDYKANQKGCVYVITSNFEKLRFYISDATEFLEFNLFELSEEDFMLMYLCLQKDNIFQNLPLKIKEDSLVVEEQITKEFYKDYSIFKRELYRDLVKRNAKRIKNSRKEELEEVTIGSAIEQELQGLEKNVKLALFKKSQKLIDRFLFIFFSEDRGLLPPNSTVQILNKWKADLDFGDERPLYNLFKQYFNYLDTGRKGTASREEVYAYNGGLFKPDSILDGLEIDDDLLYCHTLKLATYDFESQVDVNILGHIFENSLNEIESINAEIEGTKFDQQKSKRKKDGVFYTPKYITKYIVENTIGKLCEEKKEALGFTETEYFKSRANRPKKKLAELVQLLYDYRDWLLQLTICDLACGSGAFLNQALDFLIKEHKYIDELKTKVLGGGLVFADIENTILENNIYGVDLNEESVEIAKLSLWLRTAQPRRKLNDLNSNIKCGNSLIDDKKVAGNKAFNWPQEFPKVFEKGGFDVVIGNPPYGASFDKLEKIFIKCNYSSYQYKFESYLYFYEKGIELINPDGYLSYITPELFLRLEKSDKVRRILLEQANVIEIKFCGEGVFADVKVNSVVLTLNKSKNSKEHILIFYENNNSIQFLNSRWKSTNNYILEYEISDEKAEVINKILVESKYLGDIGDCIQGLTPYDSYQGQSQEIIKTRAYHFKERIDDTCGKWLDGKNLNRYSIIEGDEWLKYGDWLAAPREPKFFELPRILFREIPGRNKRIQASYTNKIFYYGHSITPFIVNDSKFEILYILSIANSKLISSYASLKCSNFSKSTFPKLNPKDIKELPIREIPLASQEPFIRRFRKSHQKIK